MSEGLVALARRTPVTKGAIADLARRTESSAAATLALRALDEAGATTAMVLACAAVVRGDTLDPKLTRALLPEVLSLDQVGPLAHATSGGAAAVLAAFLEDRWGDVELECLALLLYADVATAPSAPTAATAAASAEPAPRGVLARARWLARHKLSTDASVHLGAAAIRLHDADLSTLAAPHIGRAKRAKRAVEETLEIARSKMLDVLPEVDGARLSSGFTVKNDAKSVGRNDPCPCGSGKKYKKCHALAEAPAEEAPSVDASLVGPDQAALLRPSEIAALDVMRLSAKTFTAAFRRVVDFRQWDLALRMLARAQGDERTSLTREALHGAFEARDRDAAERLFAALPEEIASRDAIELECLRAPPNLLAILETEAEASLRHDTDGGRGMFLASALLRFYPALGIYVARGALHEARTDDSRALLEAMEDARDRLLLPPFEAWWDVYDVFFDAREERREQKRDDAKREKLKADLKAARAASRKTASELEKLQDRVKELDATLSPTPRVQTKEARAPEPSPDLTEERKRLKTKIEELQRIIGEGQEERRELRALLADREAEDEREDEPREAAHNGTGRETRDTRDTRESGAETEARMHDEGAVDAPRNVLVPRFADRAAKALADLASDAADGVLSVVAGLAAGKPNAWSGVKQLTKARGVLSARAGIHHRVLFAVNDRTLDVLEVLHRRDLEQAVTRLASR